MVPPIVIRLAVFEVYAVKRILEDAVGKVATNKKGVKLETVVLAEFFIPWQKKLTSHVLATGPVRLKEKKYAIPVSVARILHYRIQQIPFDITHQGILAKLDYELVNCGMKPDYPTKLL